MKRIFYGWYMVAAGCGLQFLQSSLLMQSFGAYVAVSERNPSVKQVATTRPGSAGMWVWNREYMSHAPSFAWRLRR